MAYIKYTNDPIRRRVSAAFADLCNDSLGNKKALVLTDNCFNIINGAETETSFCALKDFIYPVDSQSQINFEICAGDTLSLFDNSLTTIELEPSKIHNLTDVNYPLGLGLEYIPPSGIYQPTNMPGYHLLQPDKSYVRGIILYIKYSNFTSDGMDAITADQKSNLLIYTLEQEQEHILNPNIKPYIEIPLYSFYAHFTNPETRSAFDLINKIEIQNNTANSCLTVNGLIIYTKSNVNPGECSC